MSRRTLILPIGAGVIGMDDVPLVRIMDSDETPTSITVYGVVDTVQPVLSVTWTVNGVEQEGDVTKSPVLELTDLQPETSYAITLRATNINGESQASTKTIWTKRITTITPADVVDGVTYYDYQDVYRTGTMPEMDETDITVSGRDVTVPAGHYADTETVSVSSEYIIPTGTKNINANGTDDVTQYASVNVNVPASAVDTGTKQTNITTNGTQTFDVVGYANNEVTVNVQPNLETVNITPQTSPQTIVPTGNVDGYDRINVSAVTGAIDPNITPSNIKDGVTILGVTGSFDPTPDLGTLNVTPSTSAQTITPSGLDGWDEVDVAPVSSNIDANIQAGNIKDGVTILGVTGTYQGGVQPSGTLNIVNNGIYDITNYANVNVQVAQGDYNELCFTALQANSNVGMTHNGTNATTTKPVIYYSTDGRQTWTSWDGTTITLSNVGDKVYFYGYNPNGFSTSEYNYSNFNTTGSLECTGNVMSLITRYGDRETIPSKDCFYKLFYQTNITTAPDLPASVLIVSCYKYMFSGCTSLTAAPQLASTSLANNCYQYMFDGCTSLTTTPALPADKVFKQSYSYMFSNCTGLTTVTSLPATAVLPQSYEYMFSGCTSLVTVPQEIPATELDQNCYQYMFRNCTSLTTAPELPATNLKQNCYYGMFEGCTSLTTAPELPATTLGIQCYYRMFNGCQSLNKITVLTETWSVNAAGNWVQNVAASGTFVKPYALQVGTGTGQIPLDSASGIPTGWTVKETASISDDNEYITFNMPSGCDVYYTTDGSTPTTSSTLYTTPIEAQSFGDSFTLKWITTDNNGFVSSVNEYKYYNMFYIEAAENNTVLNLQGWGKSWSSEPDKVAYSRDKKTWTAVARNTTSFSIPNAGDKVYFRKLVVNGDTWGYGNLSGVPSGTIKTGGCLEYAVYWDITGNRPVTGGCGNMFQNCTALVDASKLKLFGTAYESMFSGCTNLTAVPELPATILTRYSYRYMFRNCTSLTTPPYLPATTLDESCYESMFQGCTSLVTAPNLPATIQSYQCYYQMFKGCTSLTTSPKIMLDNIFVQAAGYGRVLYEMFSGCTSLQSVEVATTNWNVSSAQNWLANVAPTGTFIKPAELVIGTGFTEIPLDSPNGIPVGWTAVEPTPTPTDPDMLNFTANQNNSTIGYTSTLATPPTMYKSTDGVNFDSWDGTAVTLNQGDTLWVYGANQALATNTTSYTQFTMTGSIAADGDATYLLQNGGTTTLSSNYAMYKLFNGCSSLTTAPSLPATTLTENCYRNMFGDCSSLTIAPALPATTLDDECYSVMFYNCTSLTTGPTISATTLAYKCCDSMFMGCTGLTTAPQLQATTMAESCYDAMFNGCTSLTTAPSLSGTTLAKDCYKSMFMNCSSLTTPPTLPATNLTDGCYRMMFLGCSSLTSAPALNATTMNTYSYAYMFSGCSSLTTPPALPATTLAEACYQYMFQNCTGLTTAPNLSATTMAVECYDGMFSGCTALTTAPSLPATTIANGCYVCMFEGCTSLTTAPVLSVATLANSCYRRMFKGCSSLSSITCFATSISAFDCTVEWVDGVAANGTFTRECSMSDWTTGVNGIPTGWTVTDNCPPVPTPTDPDMLHFTAQQANSTVALSSPSQLTLFKSSDGVNFDSWDGTAVTLSNIGDTLWVYGTNNTISLDQNSFSKFVMTGKIAAGGDATYLFQNGGITTLPNTYAMYGLFRDCTALTVAPELPATTLTDYCYSTMFYRCTNLTTGPDLPATTLTESCYSWMFYKCENLVSIPSSLPATTISTNAYTHMFDRCYRITTAPNLPATNIGNGGYFGMFYGCTSLVNVQQTLSATTLGTQAYAEMFLGCYSLVNAPSLPCTTLSSDCYRSMFRDCTSLVNAPALPASTLVAACYSFMFYGCTALQSISVSATSWNTTSTASWVYNVPTGGTFTKRRGTNITTGDDGIPSGWTVVNV